MSDDTELDPVPPYLRPRDVQDACPLVSGETILTDLSNAGLLQRFRPGSHYRISKTALRERLPDYYDQVLELFLSRHEDFQIKKGRAQASAGETG